MSTDPYASPTDEEWERMIEWERDLEAEPPEWYCADHGWRCFCLECQSLRDDQPEGERS